jgi:hypothetical protein
MTQDEIMEMARRAHFDSKTWVDIFADNPTVGDVRNYLIAFAKLVAAKAIAELESQERNFCPRCGKRTNDIHTCTPPKHTEQEPVGFAGIEMWIGNTRIKKLMTQTELHFAIDPWAIVKFNSDSCIDALKEKNT